MANKAQGASAPTKDQVSIANAGAMLQNGKLKIPPRSPATPIDAKIDHKEKVLVGGNNLHGTKKAKRKQQKQTSTTKQAAKTKVKKVCSHPLVADLEKLLPKGWTVVPTEGYFSINNPDGETVGHSRNNLSGDYLSVRVFPESAVRKPKTVKDLEAIVTELTEAYTKSKETKKVPA